jgi:hypothetical protein
MNKECFKCHEIKNLDDFYKHHKMGDGHLNKCKKCTQKDSAERASIMSLDVRWVAKEKKRGRNKYHRLGYRGIQKNDAEAKRNAIMRFRNKFPEKYKAKCALGGKIKPLIKGNHLHHWSYNAEHYLDVIELTILDHNKLHRYLIYDNVAYMYKRIDTGDILDTKDKHISYFDEIKHMD